MQFWQVFRAPASRAAATVAMAVSAIVLWTAAARADVYGDTVGDNAGPSYVDIGSVEVTNDATNISFKITLVGDISIPNSTDFGNYHIGFDVAPGGKTTPGVAWGNPFGLNGMDYWVGSWVNFGGGAELHQYTGDGTSNSWGATIPGTTVTLSQFSTTLTIPLANLGLSHGNVVTFDAWSTFGTPGGQSAYDASSNPALAVADPWNGTSYSSGNNVSVYTVFIPEPTSAAALTGALVMSAFARRPRQRS